MPRRHTSRIAHRLPSRWLMTDERMGEALWPALAALPTGSGIVFRHYRTAPAARATLFARVARIARRRGLILILAGDAVRGVRCDGRHNRSGPGLGTASAHSAREAIRAQRHGADLLFVSPVFPTRSHPGARALSACRAAAIARAVRIPVIALGGMDERRYRAIRGLGFDGWAGIDAWIMPRKAR